MDPGVWRYASEGVAGPMGLAAFGRVATGLDLAEALARVPADPDIDPEILVEMFRAIERGRLAGHAKREPSSE